MQEPAKPHAFLQSNLFIFLLGQAFAFICWLVIFAFGWGKYSERFTTIDKAVGELQAKHARIEALVTTVEQQTREIGQLTERIRRMETDTAHFDVMEAEHLRLTKDVENLKNGKK